MDLYWPGMAVGDTTTASTFIWPKIYSFPPFFTPQPNALTRASQLARWSALVQSYCRHSRTYTLTLVEALDTPLFHNSKLKKRLSAKDAKDLIDYMASEEGDARAEWLGPDRTSAWIFWRKPEEWAALIASWVDETGQKGSVLTLYELIESEATEQQEFHGMDMDVMRKSLNTLAKKGKAQVFGEADQQGVKII